MRSVQLSALVTLVTLVICIGCADASIRKVPKRSDYTEWSDKKQAEVDGMRGLRVYRARAYVVVKKPFPVSSESMLVDGVISADGRSVRLTPKSCRDLGNGLRHWGVGTVSDSDLPTSAILPKKPDAAPPSPGDGGGVAFGPARSTQQDDPAMGPAGRAAAGVVTPGELDQIQTPKDADAPTGTATLRLSTDLSAASTQVLSDSLDVTYLPDYEEEYVIDPRANLGDVNLTITQGPGGVLLAMGMRVDNRAITRPLVDVYSKAIAKAGERVVGALGDAMTFGAGRTYANDVESQSLKGQSVTLRVTYVKMASEGIYPILKDSELLECRNCGRVMGKCVCGKYCALKDASDTEIMPVYPGTRVAYQFHRVVVVEPFGAAPAAAAPPGPKGVVTFGVASGMALASGGAARSDLRLSPDIVAALNAVLPDIRTRCNVTIRIVGVSAYSPADAADLAHVEAITATYQMLDAGLSPIPEAQAIDAQADVQNGIKAEVISAHPKNLLKGLRTLSLSLLRAGGA